MEGRTFLEGWNATFLPFYGTERFYGSEGPVRTIKAADTPRVSVPVFYNGADAVRVDMVFDFRIFVVAQTSDRTISGNEAALVASEAMAHWQFDGSGFISGFPLYQWTGDGAADRIISGWTPVTGWAQPPEFYDPFKETSNEVLKLHEFHQGD
jgi:hypothetical protein